MRRKKLSASPKRSGGALFLSGKIRAKDTHSVRIWQGRILALDYGGKRIGIAISDPSQTVAFPRKTLEGQSHTQVLAELRTLIQEEKVGELLLGWPLNMQGEATKQTQKTGTFLELLKKTFTLPVKVWDERLTSVQAERTGGDDAVAAQILLQNYLDALKKKKG